MTRDDLDAVLEALDAGGGEAPEIVIAAGLATVDDLRGIIALGVDGGLWARSGTDLALTLRGRDVLHDARTFARASKAAVS